MISPKTNRLDVAGAILQYQARKSNVRSKLFPKFSERNFQIWKQTWLKRLIFGARGGKAIRSLFQLECFERMSVWINEPVVPD